ncbi:hypothetical protein N234_23245 [Ralstonia pickettii DTP0602]|nr:hypothetical protein N234_23245 [Ralstonia pickettii DTP0602]
MPFIECHIKAGLTQERRVQLIGDIIQNSCSVHWVLQQRICTSPA